MTAPELLRAQLAEVAARRAARDAAVAELKAKREQFDRDYAEIIDEAARTGMMLAESENSARALIVAIYQSDPQKNKQIADGAAVKVTKVYTYDAGKALAWARETKMALIPESVDRKALERIAKATPLPFVTITEEPSATLASDLSQYLDVAPVQALAELRVSEIAEVSETDKAEIPF